LLRVCWGAICLASLVGIVSRADGQAAAPVANQQAVAPQQQGQAAATAEAQQVPRVPGLSVWRGFNAGLTFSQVHDSSAGWYNLLTPAISYSFSRHYSADASISVYPYRLVQVQSGSNSTLGSSTQLVADHGDVSDLIVGVHGSFAWNEDWRTTVTILGTAPTGSRFEGLGAGKFTYDVSDRVDRYFDHGSLMVDLGGGDTSGLFNRQITQDQTSVGTVVHFAVGGVLYLPRNMYLQTMGYELLPMGQQTVYATVSPPGTPPMQIITGTGVSEENGITTTLGVPLTSHITLWSYYNRSLRQQTDTVSTGITYVFRPSVRRKHLSLIDRALREAENTDP